MTKAKASNAPRVLNINANLSLWGDQKPFVEDLRRYVFLVGGIGSGKTRAAVVKTLMKCLACQGKNILIVAPDYNRIHGSVIPMFMEVFPKQFWKEEPHGNPPEALTVNNNTLFFRTTTNPEDLRGYNVIGIQWDEPSYSPYEAFPILAGRLRSDTGAQMWGATTPNRDNPLNWVYAEFATGSGKEKSHALYSLRTQDNPFLPLDYVEDLKRRYSKDMQLIEMEGQFIPMSGNCFFETTILKEMLDFGLKEPMEIRRNGDIKIWKTPGIGLKYVAGIDIAEGKQAGDMMEGAGNPDFQSMRIFNYQTGEEVAEIHCRWPMDEFLNECANLMMEYNKAYCGIEVNFNRDAGKKLLEFGYPKTSMYHRGDGLHRELGWLTTEKTRDPMLADYEKAIRDRSITLYDKECIMEHLSFIRDARGRPQAARNAHDDRVIAGAVAWQARRFARFSDDVPVAPVSIFR